VTPFSGDRLTRLGAVLLLRACLRRLGSERPSRWEPADWLRLTATLTPEEIATVALKTLGWRNERIGEWLGVGRGRADQHWQSARGKMRKVVEGR
jgi:DNA-directed RNA polymerase specialized sigma24 family protein